ncbi:CHAT domain-containing protein [Leptothoe kymatousa TAU-MAC 1615]|uniref:CHAT domain-containing protein n=1 Tax=Leptothoe kymatousa TAU-MAC 1615 TaxID=2364775 RepID=A0ABS5Y820_9CYAN|nr:CHAT domain-containing protein [Leptothoe kymatousa TAU-MAC 1615]
MQSVDYNFLLHIGAAGLAIVLVGLVERSDAQVVPAQDAIETQVVQQGQRFTISGGTPTDSSKLLFHSFEQFNLEDANTAEFLVNSNVETIVSRITNGLPSKISGLIAVSGAPASLYLMNPAGVLFGAGAGLNLGGDFITLTAERLDFTHGSFGLVGYPGNVQGNVLEIHFDPYGPSSIINLGDLRVGNSNALALMGHRVINQGTLSGGEITLAAVGHHPQVSLGNGIAYTLPAAMETVSPWLLPNRVEHATAMEVDGNGMLQLTGAQSLSELSPGTVFVGGNLTTSGSDSKIQVLGDFVATAGATVRAEHGGTILIGGDYQGRGPLPTAQTTVVDAASSLRADGQIGHPQTGGQVVVWADGSTRFLGNVSARGTQAGGSVEISGKQHLYFDGQVDLRSQGTPGTLLLDPENIEIRAGTDPGGDNNPGILYENTLETSITGNPNLVIQADDNITINPLSDGVLNFPGSIRFLADADNDGQGSFAMDPNDQLRTVGQAIEITAANITVGDLNTSAFSTIDNNLDGGDINLTATQGDIVAGNLNSSARAPLNNNGNGGSITLSAFDDIDVKDIQTTTNQILNNNGRAGDISLLAETGTINAGNLSTAISSSSNTGAGGDISLRADGNIFTDSVDSSINVNASNTENAGEVSLTSLTANIETGSIATDTNAGETNRGNGGGIAINAPQGTIRSQQLTSTAQSPDLVEPQGGDVRLTSIGDIVVDFIDASAQGNGGNIAIANQRFFQALDRIPNTDVSLLTTGDSTIRLAYNSASTTPFLVGDSSIHGTSGSLVTDVDQLIGPQSITQSVSFDTIQLINAFQVPSPDSPTVGTETPNITTPALATEDPRANTNELLRENNVLELDNNGTSANSGEEQDNVLNANSEESILVQIDNTFSGEFARALNLPMPASPTLSILQETLQEVARTQGITPGIMYVRLNNNRLELLLMSGDGPPVYHPVDVTAVEVQSVIDDLHRTVMNPLLRPAQYLPPAQQLYDWLIRPMVDDLEMANIDHIGFVLDAGLRSLPMAALHDGEQFLIEQYSIGLLPSAGLTDLSPPQQVLNQNDRTKTDSVLAMGIADFTHQADLEAVPLELELAVQATGDNYYLDHETTLAALHHQLEKNRFTSMHLATHAVFEAGNLENSYVQLWDRSISLTELQALPLDAIDFLILSACATALGDADAEFGFAGLAVKVGVRTALASLWSISDEGTLGLMAEFYQALGATPSRSAALRQAQIAMLRGDVGVHHGQVYGHGNRDIGYLPGLDASGSWNFSHPAYWSGFTMIGNPW